METKLEELYNEISRIKKQREEYIDVYEKEKSDLEKEYKGTLSVLHYYFELINRIAFSTIRGYDRQLDLVYREIIKITK